MPLFKCSDCHHEWEGMSSDCDWCGREGKILQEKTSLELAIEKVANSREFWNDFGEGD